MNYLLLAIDPAGRVRYAMTTEPTVPDEFLRQGEIAFVVQPLDMRSSHYPVVTPLRQD